MPFSNSSFCLPEGDGDVLPAPGALALQIIYTLNFTRPEKLRTWRERQIVFTGKDPLICPICKKEMKLVGVAFFSSKEEKIVVYGSP